MDTVEIGGKQYVSAKSAARAHGYTMDYIGQLIRGGKLQGNKVGRAWYVETESLAAFTGGDMAPKAFSEVPAAVSAPAAPKTDTPVRPAAPSKEAVRELSEVFGMRYLSEEEPMLPEISKRTPALPQEEREVPLRAIHAPIYTPPARHEGQKSQETAAPISPVRVAPATQVAPVLRLESPFKGRLLLAAGCAAVLFVLTAASFMERTFSIEGNTITAGVAFSELTKLF